jgi:hypothetical protein
MASRTRSGLLLPLLIVAGLVVAMFGVNKVTDVVEGIFRGDPVMVGEGAYQFLVGNDGEGKARKCTAQTTLTTRRCGDLKVVIIDAAKMSFIARNIKLAWLDGKPALLHRESTGARTKRGKVCGSFKKTYPRGSCDEYAFASSQEGGADSRTEEVHEDEQDCQGGTISWAYRNLPINEGEEYLLVIGNPDKIATQAWAGQEVRVNQCLS